MMRLIKREWPLLVWSFFISSFCGWLYEVGWELYLDRTLTQAMANKGSFNLFILPIYGFGGLILILCMKNIVLNQRKIKVLGINITPIVVFVATVIISTIVEYIGSCIIEDLGYGRLWDYTGAPYSLNGRIALKNSLIFGIIGVIGIYGVIPLIRMVLKRIGRRNACISAIIILGIFALDCVLISMGYKFR
ncbi:MAG: putative ABC transporter permease [Clostridia bacterium]|nr:putative ABC transporter permease [Clostridia bacterium]